MDNNILLKTAQVVYEPHVYADRELPFIFHEFHKDQYYQTNIRNVHRNPELLYITDGSGKVRKGDTVYDVVAGDLVVIDTYVMHQVVPDPKVDYFCLIVDMDFCISNRLNVDRLSFPAVIRDGLLNESFGRIVSEYRKADSFAVAGIRCSVLELMLDLCRRFGQLCEKPVELNPSLEYVRKAMVYIQENISKKLSLSEIADNVGLSKYYFLRRFRECTGMTVVEYVNALRCEYAAELLYSGQYSVKQAAAACGFENFSYFTSVFKKYAGVLPSEYLKRPESQ